MSLPIFPAAVRGLTWPVPKGAGFSTIVQSAPNNLEMTVSQARNPRWTWQFTYGYLKDFQIQSGQNYTDYRILQDFLLALAGSGGEFLFTDPTDYNLGPNNTATQGPLQLVNDGASSPTYYSPVQRLFGGTFYEDIADLNGTLQVYANGALKRVGVDYNLLGPGLAIPGYSWMGMVIQWITPPTAPITAQGSFYFRCRFSSDESSIDQFMQSIWTYGGANSTSGEPLVFKSSPPVQV